MADPALTSDPGPLAAKKPPLTPEQGVDLRGQTETVEVTPPKESPLQLFEREDAEAVDRYQKQMEQVKLEQARNPEPKPFVEKPLPQTQYTDPIQAWGSSAMLLAGIGSLMTRGHMTTAMNAAANVMKAYRQNDVEAAQQAFNEWKASNDEALKVHNAEVELYKAANEKAKTDASEARADFSVAAKLTGNQIAAWHAQNSDLHDREMYTVALDRLAVAQTKAAAQTDELNTYHQYMASDEAKQKMKGMSLLEQAKFRHSMMVKIAPDLTSAMGLFSDDAIHYRAQLALAGDFEGAFAGVGRDKSGSMTRSFIIDDWADLMKQKGWTGADQAAAHASFQGIKAGYRTVYVTEARIGLGIAEMKRIEPQLLAASEELSRTNYPSFNAVLQAAEKETGNVALRSFANRVMAAKAAFSQALSRGGMPTDSVRSSADEMMATNDPHGVTQASLIAMNDEAEAIRKAPADVRKELQETLPTSPPLDAGARGPARATLDGKPIWPNDEGTGWVYQDGTPVKQ